MMAQARAYCSSAVASMSSSHRGGSSTQLSSSSTAQRSGAALCLRRQQRTAAPPTAPGRRLAVPVRAKARRSGSAQASSTEVQETAELIDISDSKTNYEAPVQPPSWMLPASTFGFMAIAFDIKSPLSFHLLENIDQAIHLWNFTHTSPAFKSGFADVFMSDAFIVTSLLGWFYASYQLLKNKDERGLRRVLVGLALYIGGGGFVLLGDPVLVYYIKEFFHRSRPSNIIHFTYSFPSGHTTGAVFMGGYLLFGLLPLLLQGRGDNIKGTGRERKQLRSTLMKIWAAAGVTTASARMLADVHWFSDTMAGACLGVFLTTLGTTIIAAMEKMTEPEEVLAVEQAAALQAEPEPEEE